MAALAGTTRQMRWALALVLAGLALLLAGLPSRAQQHEQAPPQRSAMILHLDGAIGPASHEHVRRGLDRAAEEQAVLVVLRMDTPGGLDSSMRDIIREILRSPVPVATYVAPAGARAASAGTYILYASHVAAMAPGTNVGAATPVQLGGGGGSPFGGGEEAGNEQQAQGNEQAPRPGTAMEAKALNDAIAYIRSLAEMRGRNADWAEAAVRTAESIPASAALEMNVIDILAEDLDDLMRQLDGRTVIAGGAERALATEGLARVEVQPDWRIRLLGAITNPNVALILMMVGIYGLLFEFMNPGALYPGTIGAISLLLALYSLAALPVNYAGIALILLGLALMAAEAFTPSFGILGIGGVIAFILGATIMIDTDVPQFQISWAVLAALALSSLVIVITIARLAMRSHRRRVVSGREGLVGATGMVLDWQGDRGHVFVQSERWRAFGVGPLSPGATVRVRAVDGLILEIEPAAAGESADPPHHQWRNE